jgi:hypothetical protein
MPSSQYRGEGALLDRQRIIRVARVFSMNTIISTGIHWYAQIGKWQAAISHSGKMQYLGCFNTEEAAARAYDASAKRLRTTPIFQLPPRRLPQPRPQDVRFQWSPPIIISR